MPPNSLIAGRSGPLCCLDPLPAPQVMFYRDMSEVAGNERTRLLSFHVCTPLKKFGT